MQNLLSIILKILTYLLNSLCVANILLLLD
jgi:hypothetical protein